MNIDCFNCLCQRIICSISERDFRSESYIAAFLKDKDSMYIANVETTGGYISGKVKLAASLRLLACGDSYDFAVIFNINSNYVNEILHYVMKYWVIQTGIVDRNIIKYLRDKEHMARVNKGFSIRSS